MKIINTNNELCNNLNAEINELKRELNQGSHELYLAHERIEELERKNKKLKDLMNNRTVPCYCGKKGVFTLQNIKTKYNDKYIIILNVPTYICENDHIKMSKYTRIQLKNELKLAYENNLTEREFTL